MRFPDEIAEVLIGVHLDHPSHKDARAARLVKAQSERRGIAVGFRLFQQRQEFFPRFRRVIGILHQVVHRPFIVETDGVVGFIAERGNGVCLSLDGISIRLEHAFPGAVIGGGSLRVIVLFIEIIGEVHDFIRAVILGDLADADDVDHAGFGCGDSRADQFGVTVAVVFGDRDRHAPVDIHVGVRHRLQSVVIDVCHRDEKVDIAFQSASAGRTGAGIFFTGRRPEQKTGGEHRSDERLRSFTHKCFSFLNFKFLIRTQIRR